MPTQELALFSIGALPYLLILGALVLMSVFFFLTKLTMEDMTEILVAMGTIWLVVILVLLFISHVCMSISPVEQFADADFDIEGTEAAVCKLITDVRNFITSDIGQPGQADPSLITAAMQKAIDAVKGPITTCPEAPASAPAPSDPAIIEDRLARMERTLEQLVEPQFKYTYDKAMTCEGFASGTPQERLTAIQATIATLKARYLDPLDQKQADLQAGHLSDCEKRKAANTAIPPKK
jgi:hypothetical protein